MYYKSKIIYKLIIFIFSIFIINFNNNVLADYSVINTKEYTYESNLNDVRSIENFILIYYNNSTSVLYNGDEYLFDFYIDDIKYYNDVLYILSNNRVFNYSIYNNSNIELFSALNSKIKGIEVCNNIIYLVGEKDGDSYLSLYNLKGELIAEYTYGGSGIESFNYIKYYENSIYILGIISSNSIGSVFKNTGNSGYSFILIEFKNNIFNVFYNEFYSKSYSYININNCIFYDDIGVLINNELYKIDYEFNVIPYESSLEKYEGIIYSKEGIKGYIIEDGIVKFNDYNDIICDTNISYIVYLNDTFYGILLDKNKVVLYELFIYEVIHNDEIKISYFNNSYDFNDYIKINSLFSNFTIEIDNSSFDKKFKKNMAGTYSFNYKISVSNKFIYIPSKIIVSDYVNIIDGGIYQTGKELIYYGDATLDDKTIYNGYICNTEGEHKLTVTNYNGSFDYYFTCLSEYYKDDDSVTFNSDYYINPLDKVRIIISFDKELDINSLYINSKIYKDYEIKFNQLIIYIPGSDYYSIDYYKINKIIYNDNNVYKELYLDNSFYVTTLKESPNVSLYESLENNKITLSYTIVDEAKTIFYILREYYYNGELKFTKRNYFLDNINIDDINYEYLNEIEYLVYFNGYEFVKFLISDSKVSDIKNNSFEECSYNSNNYVNSYTKYFNLENANYEYIKVNNENTIENLKIINNNISFNVVIKICVCMIIITFIFIVIKHFIFKILKKNN